MTVGRYTESVKTNKQKPKIVYMLQEKKYDVFSTNAIILIEGVLKVVVCGRKPTIPPALREETEKHVQQSQ